MPWKKQFDVEIASEKAKTRFWSHGYEATSMEDLLSDMGINRGSFYDTFGSKEQLYAETLRRYDQAHRRAVLQRLEKENGPRERILKLFDAVCSEARGRNGRCGCFLANAALERAASNATVAKIIRVAFTEIEEFFRAAIEEGQAHRAIQRKLDAQATARTLLGMLLGMRVLARSGAPSNVLESIAQQVKQMI